MWIFKDSQSIFSSTFSRIISIVASITAKVRETTQIDLASLCCFRIIFCIFTILFGWHSYIWITTVPDAFFNPPVLSLASLLQAFPGHRFFWLLDAAIGLCTITLLLGLFTRLSTILLLCLVVIGSTFHYSMGKIDHGETLYLCVLLAMCFQNWGAMFSVDSLLRKSPESDQLGYTEYKRTTDLSFLAILIAFGFFTAGWAKAFSWADFDLTTSGFLSWFYNGYLNQGRDQFLAPFVLNINAPLIWELVDISAVIFEIGFLFAMLSRRSWYAWLTIACLFHLMIGLLLNISFEMNAIAYMAFVPWAQLPILAHLASGQLSKQLKWPQIALAAFGVFALLSRLRPLQNPSLNSHALALAGGADMLEVNCGIWIVTLLIFCFTFKTFINFSGREYEVLARYPERNVSLRRDTASAGRTPR